jgi:hypothetical protein
VSRPIRFAILACLLLLALLVLVSPQALPPRPAATPPPHWPADETSVRGAYHVHSTASDGTGSLDEIAAAAANAGLQFVILTDHGDATRVSEPPAYRSGVLCIEAVEINTSHGHLVALGSRPSPYPLAGAAVAVLEDVHRLGGIGVAAHPGSPRESLRWSAWDVPVDGLEWLNADSEWRDELLGSLGRLLLTYALRPPAALTATLDRPEAVLAQWDTAARTRRVVGLAGADAHARLGFPQQTEPLEDGWHVKLPSYETSFNAFSLRVMLDVPLSGDPSRDAAALLGALKAGRTYTVIDGLAAPGAFDFTATSGGAVARMGDYLDLAGEVGLHMRMAAPVDSRLVVLRNGEELFDTRQPELHLGVVAEPAVYRIEVYLPRITGDPPIPWIVSNPIYVGLRDLHARARPQPTTETVTSRSSIATEAWQAEASAGSLSRLLPSATADGVTAIEWEFQLAGGPVSGQYAAVKFPIGGLRDNQRLQLRLRADRPMRLWVQLRDSTSGDGERWGQSVYVDDTFRFADVSLSELDALGVTSSAAPALASVDALLLVVDTLNTRPATVGRLRIQEMWIAEPISQP